MRTPRTLVPIPPKVAAQIDKILRVAQAGQVVAHIIPLDAGVYPATDSNFLLLEFTDPLRPMPPVVYVEGLGSGQLYERPPDIQGYRKTIEYVRDFSLNPTDSLRLLGDVRKYWAHE